MAPAKSEIRRLPPKTRAFLTRKPVRLLRFAGPVDAMDKRIFDFTDSRLLAGAAALYELNVVAGTDGFSFLAADPTGAVLTLKAWHFDNYDGDFEPADTDLRAILASEPVLQSSFSRVRCAVFNRQATLVPRRLFSPDALSSYFQLLLPQGDFEYGYEALPNLDCYLVYALDKRVGDLLLKYLPAQNITHLASPVLQKALDVVTIDATGLLVNLRNEVAQVMAFERGNLLFYNAFSFDKASDLLYFVLLAYDQCRLSPDRIPLWLAGEALPDSEIYKQLYRYVRHVRFVAPPGNYHWPTEAPQVSDHMFFDLFCLKS